MTCTAFIHEDVTEPNGRRRIWVEYTHVETGTKHWAGSIALEAADNAQAKVDALCPGVNDYLMRVERERIRRKVFVHGLDRNDFPPVFNAPGRVEKFLVRSIWNAVAGRTGKNTGEPGEVMRHIINANTFLGTVTQVRLRNLLNLTNAEANQFRADVQALADADAAFVWITDRLDENEP